MNDPGACERRPKDGAPLVSETHLGGVEIRAADGMVFTKIRRTEWPRTADGQRWWNQYRLLLYQQRVRHDETRELDGLRAKLKRERQRIVFFQRKAKESQARAKTLKAQLAAAEREAKQEAGHG